MDKNELMDEKTILTFLSKLNKMLLEREDTSDDARDLALLRSCVLDVLARNMSLMAGISFWSNRGNPYINIYLQLPDMHAREVLEGKVTLYLKPLGASVDEIKALRRSIRALNIYPKRTEEQS